MKLKRMLIIEIGALALLLAMAVNAYVSYNRDISVHNERIKELDRQIAEQKEYSKELDVTGSEYASQDGVVKIARETLGLVKSGEKFFKNYNDIQ